VTHLLLDGRESHFARKVLVASAAQGGWGFALRWRAEPIHPTDARFEAECVGRRLDHVEEMVAQLEPLITFMEPR